MGSSSCRLARHPKLHFLYSNFLSRFFFLAAIFELFQNANVAGFGMFVWELNDHYYGYTFSLMPWSRRG